MCSVFYKIILSGMMIKKGLLWYMGLIGIACWILVCCAAQSAIAQQRDTLRIYFPFDKSQLTTLAEEEINRFVTDYKAGNGSNSLIIRGHCDAIGSQTYNDQLSDRRANTVHRYLIEKGVPSTAVSFVRGFGETVPLNTNATAAERQANRRVEIVWTSQPAIIKDTISPGPPRDTIPALTQETIRTVEEGQTLRLRNINFIGGRHTFLPQSEPALKELLVIMKNNPTLVIEIQGHICCLPGSTRDGFDFDANDYNLSFNRARAVYDFLYQNGIAANRMTYKGFAWRVPLVYPEYTEEDRTTNRRVEIKIIRK